MSSSSLEVPRRQRSAKRATLWRIVAIIGAVALVVGWLVWFLRTPDGLATSSRTVTDGGTVGQEMYVGMFAVGDDFGRTLHISEIAVPVEPEEGVEVTPLICRGGSLSVTTDVDPYCPELDEAENADFSDGDSIVLAVTASEPVTVEIGRLEISFRDGFQFGDEEAGLESVTLTFAEHEPGVVEESPESEDPTGERPGSDDENEERKRDKKKDETRDEKRANA